ncbi:hypothetical protein JR316_0000020 [Psilocybe cubensis]|uniref:Uncharacterized protein n=3 Tax=Psilocybe cubensis TaxID=181762 RepID=A0A8H8CNT9_PSICU|nr:hypothetical protein JR316_0003491 [Psilocybe cubensis]XP_047753584.1 hypothetical protein JR316_0000020 [Psilocybe cubensis]KAH9484012.1 hypothetical protein JR316_0003491 [Psilocybe cubensis]KAH9485959.1 hypothetical protein JR316_0000020 [Psilocybe cubensis]
MSQPSRSRSNSKSSVTGATPIYTAMLSREHYIKAVSARSRKNAGKSASRQRRSPEAGDASMVAGPSRFQEVDDDDMDQSFESNSTALVTNTLTSNKTQAAGSIQRAYTAPMVSSFAENREVSTEGPSTEIANVSVDAGRDNLMTRRPPIQVANVNAILAILPGRNELFPAVQHNRSIANGSYAASTNVQNDRGITNQQSGVDAGIDQVIISQVREVQADRERIAALERGLTEQGETFKWEIDKASKMYTELLKEKVAQENLYLETKRENDRLKELEETVLGFAKCTICYEFMEQICV